MSATPQTPEINLIAGDELSGRPGGEIVRWALTYGKAVVVVTELIVVLAFISRFALDSQIADLNDQIGKKKDIVVASKDFENSFRSFSLRVSAIRELLTPVQIDQALSDTKNLLPQGVVIQNLAIKDKQVSMGGFANSETDLAVLSGAFKNSPRFNQVILERVSRGDTTSKNKQPSSIDFSLTAMYQPLSSNGK